MTHTAKPGYILAITGPGWHVVAASKRAGGQFVPAVLTAGAAKP